MIVYDTLQYLTKKKIYHKDRPSFFAIFLIFNRFNFLVI